MRRESKEPALTETRLIAVCGLNCRLCRAHIRDRNPCPGCRAEEARKPKTRVRCAIKTCDQLQGKRQQFCSFCSKFPCQPILHLDKRYQTRYKVSPIANLARIKDVGVRKFAAEEKARWLCPGCAGVLCMHEPRCVNCGRPWRDDE